MPESNARSITANASGSLSPIPKNSGADPTPPKLPHPRPSRETRRPVVPSRRYSMAKAYPVAGQRRHPRPRPRARTGITCRRSCGGIALPRLLPFVSSLSVLAGMAAAAEPPTVLLDNDRVRVLRVSTTEALAEHPAAVIVPLEDGVFGKTGAAYWSGETSAPRVQGKGLAASAIVIEPKDAPPPRPLVPAPPASGPGTGGGVFVGMSFAPLFENGRVAVIRGRMDVGATEGFHTHASDIVLVHLSGGVIEDTANGQTKVNRWQHGDVELEARGSSHSARNLGAAVDAVLVTLKP